MSGEFQMNLADLSEITIAKIKDLVQQEESERKKAV